MQVDRIYFQIRQFYMKGGKTDIDTLIVSLCYYSGERREEHAENRMKNTHVQTFELIEESSDSNSWLMLFLCVYCLHAQECLLLDCICFVYAMHVISCFNMKSERGRE
jgi:hypothetical protein